LNNNEFINFRARTREGGTNSVLCLNPATSDAYHPHVFTGTKFNNVDPSAMAFIMSPNPGWANLKDCVEFPCTAPHNILFSFLETQYHSNQKFNYGSTFQVIANNPGVGPHIPTCKLYKEMNCYICHNEHLSMMMFESGDEDTEDRNIAPIWVQMPGT